MQPSALITILVPSMLTVAVSHRDEFLHRVFAPDSGLFKVCSLFVRATAQSYLLRGLYSCSRDFVAQSRAFKLIDDLSKLDGVGLDVPAELSKEAEQLLARCRKQMATAQAVYRETPFEVLNEAMRIWLRNAKKQPPTQLQRV